LRRNTRRAQRQARVGRAVGFVCFVQILLFTATAKPYNSLIVFVLYADLPLKMYITKNGRFCAAGLGRENIGGI